MVKQLTRLGVPALKTLLLLSFVFLSSCALTGKGPSHSYISHQLQGDSLIIQSEIGEVRFTALPGEAIEVHYVQTDVKQLPSFAKDESLQPVKPGIEAQESTISLVNGEMTAIIEK